jgi:hypothetical protein
MNGGVLLRHHEGVSSPESHRELSGVPGNVRGEKAPSQTGRVTGTGISSGIGVFGSTWETGLTRDSPARAGIPGDGSGLDPPCQRGRQRLPQPLPSLRLSQPEKVYPGDGRQQSGPLALVNPEHN